MNCRREISFKPSCMPQQKPGIIVISFMSISALLVPLTRRSPDLQRRAVNLTVKMF
jgi:hypothetical protein